MNYTIYDPTTGEIIQNIACSDPMLVKHNLGDQHFIDGWYPTDQYYINNGVAVEKPGRPNDVALVFYFDYDHKDWRIQKELSQSSARQHRDRLLAQIDRVNPVWYDSLTAAQQQELQQYRQALLDVPQQPGFPQDVEWPAKPAWL